MFNDKYKLTQAVLDGRKVVTRRIVSPQPTYSELTGVNWKGSAYGLWSSDNPRLAYRNFINGTDYDRSCTRYRSGEVLAIAQRYSEVEWHLIELLGDPLYNKYCISSCSGFNNKMFVKADLMPHRIDILDVRLERMQDITEEDCLREGIDKLWDGSYGIDGVFEGHGTAKHAFCYLIDELSGKGTFESNPFVYRYEFKRVK